MFHHFFNNIQCKKIFFAGCHDAGYMHELQEHMGDPDARERIVLLETTPAEPCYRTLGFRITRFDTVFRSEPLGNERKYSTHQLPSGSPSTSSSLPPSAGALAAATATPPQLGRGAPVPLPAAAAVHQSPVPATPVMPSAPSSHEPSPRHTPLLFS